MKKLLLLCLFVFSYGYEITVSIIPQKQIVSAITGDKANVNVMVKAGSSPEMYEPKASQLIKLKNSSLYFSIGVPFENNWLAKFKGINPKIKIIDMGKFVKRVYFDKSKGVKDPHIWLSPLNVILEARVVLKTVVKYDEKNRKYYEHNYAKFVEKLVALDMKIMNILKNSHNKKFIVFHPSFGYFARTYGLIQIPIEKEGKTPSFKYLAKIINFAKSNGIKTIFVAPEFSQKSAKFIAKKIGGKVVSMSPLKPNLLENILNIAKSLKSD